MRHGYDKLNMARTFTTNLLLGHLYTATIADDSFIANTLILTAGTLIILGRTKDTLTEKAVAFRLICTIINGFRFRYLAIRIFQDLFGRSKSDGYLRKIILYLCIFFKSHFTF